MVNTVGKVTWHSHDPFCHKTQNSLCRLSYDVIHHFSSTSKCTKDSWPTHQNLTWTLLFGDSVVAFLNSYFFCLHEVTLLSQRCSPLAHALFNTLPPQINTQNGHLTKLAWASTKYMRCRNEQCTYTCKSSWGDYSGYWSMYSSLTCVHIKNPKQNGGIEINKTTLANQDTNWLIEWPPGIPWHLIFCTAIGATPNFLRHGAPSQPGLRYTLPAPSTPGFLLYALQKLTIR